MTESLVIELYRHNLIFSKKYIYLFTNYIICTNIIKSNKWHYKIQRQFFFFFFFSFIDKQSVGADTHKRHNYLEGRPCSFPLWSVDYGIFFFLHLFYAYLFKGLLSDCPCLTWEENPIHVQLGPTNSRWRSKRWDLWV